MEIQRAIDFQLISKDLQEDLHYIGYNADLRKMYSNIEKMVTELSKNEVRFRKTNNYSYLDGDVEQINKAIHHLEQFILIAKLMR